MIRRLTVWIPFMFCVLAAAGCDDVPEPGQGASIDVNARAGDDADKPIPGTVERSGNAGSNPDGGTE